MNLHNAIQTTGLLITLLLITLLVQTGATEILPSPPFPCTLERFEPAKGYASFILALGPVPEDLTVTATLVLMRGKQLAGRIPLGFYGKADKKLGLRCGPACLSDDFVQHFFGESRIYLYVHRANEAVQTYEFPLSRAVAKPEKRDAQPQQNDPANGSQPIRSETNRTSSAAGSRR